jgi:hypothetical protein
MTKKCTRCAGTGLVFKQGVQDRYGKSLERPFRSGDWPRRKEFGNLKVRMVRRQTPLLGVSFCLDCGGGPMR